MEISPVFKKIEYLPKSQATANINQRLIKNF